MKKFEYFHFEESVLDGLVDDFNKIEHPINNKVFFLVAVVAGIILVVFLGRILALNVGWGRFYQQRSLSNINKKFVLSAQRGLIVDRFDKPLLKNIPSFDVVLDVADFFKNNQKTLQELTKVSEFLDLNLENLTKEIKKINLENNDEFVIARDIDLNQVISLKTFNLKSVLVENDYKRDYIDGHQFSHILGHTGISERDNEVIGATGLESYYDQFLRGQNGEYLVLRDVKGDSIDKKIIKEARPGYKLVTTIDADFQKYFYNRLRLGLDQLERKSGVGLAINPQTGEVLALVNLPTFNNNSPAEYLKIGGQPLFNRAVSGLYNPGSTIKPLVALAALKENIVTADWQAYSAGFLELPNPYIPDKPSRFLDWRAHGWVDLHSALARSSNIYFYILGGGCPVRLNCETRPTRISTGLGIEKLKKYWELFGLHEPTGIDLDSEGIGFLPDAVEKEKRTGQIWRIGDTYNVSIGQGDLIVTPLRLLNFYASLANNGKMLRPFLVNKVIDDKNNIVKENNPEEILDYTDFGLAIREVQKGLRDTVAQPYGTANVLYDLPYKTAGKTGSAQIQNNKKTNAFFIGYGPYENPKIAILVLVEDAKEGSINTLPIAYDVLKWYYENRL